MVLVPEDGRAVELLGLPEALLDHGLLVLDARRGSVHFEAGELTVPQNVKLKDTRFTELADWFMNVFALGIEFKWD